MSQYMSDSEMIAIYRQAEDRKKQIGILADLNATSKEVITFILRRAGVLNEPKTVKKPSPQRLIYTVNAISKPEKSPSTPDKEEPVKKQLGRRKKMSPELHQQLLNLYNEGLGDREIAMRVGFAGGSSVCQWRKKHGLPANHRQGSKKSKGA